MTKYSAEQIVILNIPKELELPDEKCCRTYAYRFSNPLAEQSILNKYAKQLSKPFLFSKEKYELPEDVEVIADVEIERVDEYEARISMVTTVPEECCLYLFGFYTLPRKIEALLGSIESIQGEARARWIRDREVNELRKSQK